MSGTQVSSSVPLNILYDSISGKTGIELQSGQNQLLQQQQDIGGHEIEMGARLAGTLLSQYQTPEARAAAYPTLLASARAAAPGYFKNAPSSYPGDDATHALFQLGTSSAEQFKLGQAGTAIPTPGFNTGAAAPAAGGGTAAAPGDGLTGDREHDRALIVARESGGDPTAQNYVAKADPAAYARGATASGKYQFVNSTWREGMQLAGLDPAKYPTAREAPEAVQDQVFNAVYGKYGAAPWQKGSKDWIRDEQGQYQLATVRPTATPAPPGGGVVARNPGAVQVAGPGAGTPAAAPTTDLTGPRPLPPTGPGAPVVTPQQLANTPTNQVMPGAPNGPPAVAPPPVQAPASPAPQPPAATAPAQVAPVAVPAPQPMDEHNLTRQDYQDLDREKRSGMSGPQLDQSVQQRQNANLARQEKYRGDVRQAANDAQAANEKAIADAREAEQLRLSQESGRRDQARLEQGSTQADKDSYILRTTDPSSQLYAEAWARKKWTQAPNGNVIENDVSMYPAPARSIQRPSFLPAPTPQGLDEVRKSDTDAKVITSAIDHYTDVFSATGGKNWGAYFDNPQSPEAQQLLGAFDRMKTVLRSPVYYNTGVLQPAEIKLMGEDLVSPKSIRGLFATPQALATRLGEIKLAILTRQDAELRSIGKEGVIVRDKADFAKVPDGGQYYDKNGELRVK
jgi:hypothetical protein